MRQRLLALFVLVLAVCMVAGPVLAEDMTGSEEQRKTVPCPKKGESVPENQSPPKGKQCQGKKKKYKATVWSNDVKCAATPADLQVAKIYAGGDPMSGGGVGVCNDAGPVPVQGRVFAGGSTSDGLTIYADGDKDNTSEQLQGYARMHVDSSGPSASCGASDGKRDATNPSPEDSSEDCG